MCDDDVRGSAGDPAAPGPASPGGPMGAGGSDRELVTLLPDLFATALADAPPSAVTPLTVVAAARAERRAERLRRWAPGALAAAAVVAAVTLVVPMMTGTGADGGGDAGSMTMVAAEEAVSGEDMSAQGMSAEVMADAADSAADSAAGTDAGGDDSADDQATDDGAATDADDAVAADGPAGSAYDGSADGDMAGEAGGDAERQRCAVPGLDAAAESAVRTALGADLRRIDAADGFCGGSGAGAALILGDGAAHAQVAVGADEAAARAAAGMPADGTPADRSLALAAAPGRVVVVAYDEAAAALVGDEKLRELADAVLAAD